LSWTGPAAVVVVVAVYLIQ